MLLVPKKPLETPNQPTVNQILTLTPLRGIAALCIIAVHYRGLLTLAQPPYNLQPYFVEKLMEQSYLWVDFFFILSGFIIFHVYRSRFSQGVNRRNYYQFLVGRFSRIYPLHLFTLLVLVALQLPIYLVEPQYAFSEEYFPLWGIVTNLTLLGAIGNFPYGWNGVSWAVGAEWYTYMIFPFVLPLFLRNSLLRICLNCVLPIVLLFGLSRFSIMIPDTLLLQHDWGLFRCLLDFTLGIGIYQLYQKGYLRSLFASDYTFLLALLWIITVVLTGGHDVLTIPGFALMVISGALNQGFVSKLLNVKWLVFLGEISYSIYLIHGVLRIVLGLVSYGVCGELFCSGFSQFQLYLGWFFFTAVTIICSILAYYGVELKAREYLLKKLL